MGKEEYERKCIEDILKNISQNRFLKKRFNGNYSIDENWNESPDFLIHSINEDFGVEHFVVDLFMDDIEGVKRSGSRLSCEKMQNMYQDNHEKLINNEFDTEQAKEDVEQSINYVFGLLSQFDYEVYVNKIKDTFEKHLQKVKKYQENLKENGVGENVPIYFCIEARITIPSMNSQIYGCRLKRKDGANISTKIRQIPITKEFYNMLIRAIGVISGVFLVSYGIDDFTGQSPLDITFIDLKNREMFEACLIAQKIKVYQSFDFNIPRAELKLNILQ